MFLIRGLLSLLEVKVSFPVRPCSGSGLRCQAPLICVGVICDNGSCIQDAHFLTYTGAWVMCPVPTGWTSCAILLPNSYPFLLGSRVSWSPLFSSLLSLWRPSVLSSVSCVTSASRSPLLHCILLLWDTEPTLTLLLPVIRAL